LSSWPVALAWIGLLNLACLPLRDFWFPDEPDMARVTLDMVTRGDYLQPYRMGKVFNDYPPLFYWLASVFGRASAWSELSLRLPTLLSSLGLLAALAAWVKRRLDARAACWSVIVLGTAYTFHWQSINMHLDMLLALCVTGAVLCFESASSAPATRSRVAWYAASALAMGVASLTKGPLGLLLPSAVLGLDAVCAREWRRILPLAICSATGSLLFLAWAMAFSAHSGGEGLIYFLTRQNLDRFRGGRSHEHPFYYYLGTVWMDLAPWSLLLVPAAIDAWRAARRGERSARLLLCWSGFGLAFFSVAASKRSVYLLPILPSTAVLLARYISERIKSHAPLDRWVRAQALTAGGALILVGLVLPAGLGHWLLERESLRSFHIVSIAIVTLTLLACGVALWRVARSSSLVRAWSTVAISTAVAYFAVHAILFPSLDEPLSAKSDARWLAKRMAAQVPLEVGYFGRTEVDVPKETTALEFYGDFAIRSVSGPSAVEAYFDRPSTVLLVQKRDIDKLMGSTQRELRIERELLIGDDEFAAISDASAASVFHQEVSSTWPGVVGSRP
jgi:4-amino-4-deoxy-L-arabinose transferase-like glycosyltransferase